VSAGTRSRGRRGAATAGRARRRVRGRVRAERTLRGARAAGDEEGRRGNAGVPALLRGLLARMPRMPARAPGLWICERYQVSAWSDACAR
jgi:hypothetical protein